MPAPFSPFSREINLSLPMNVCRASAGTGKTFTLAACYVGLLLSGESYRNILAVTFTNKATAEMKERILTYLYAIANGNHAEDAFLDKARSFMTANLTATEAQLRQRSEQCFREMLQDYDNVQVSTIDSFLQTLLSGMAKMLGKGAGYSTELDIHGAIARAVDQVLSTEMDSETFAIMNDYISEQIENESNWDFRKSLILTATRLYGEEAQMLDADGEIEFDPAVILRYKHALERWRLRPEFERLGMLTDQVESQFNALAQPKLSANGKGILSAVENIRGSLNNTREVKAADRFRGMTASKWNDLTGKADRWQQEFGSLCDLLHTLQEQCSVCRRIYWECILTAEPLSDMRLMRSLLRQVNANLREDNRTLLAETACTLRSALRPGDADFILEKAGIRYKHIMIDEFQDTSKLQWGVFLPLLEEVLAAHGNTLLIVGDMKQSIYRWRNGDWHIMGALGTPADPLAPHFNTAFRPLVRNFRSRRNVVAFNLETMRRITATEQHADLYSEGYDGTNLADYYNAKNADGYVRLRLYPKTKSTKATAAAALTAKRVQQDILDSIFQTIEDLLAQGERPSDIMILVRRNREARQVVQAFYSLDHELLPHLAATQLVSADSFKLNQSASVMVVVNALRYIDTGDTVAREYITLALGRSDWQPALDALDRQLPLYEMCQEVIRLLECDAEGVFAATDIAYLNCLMDKVRDYVGSYGSCRAAFLQYWDDTLVTSAIPAPDTDAIRIMTIHSSKGLESKTLFIPFCTWAIEDSFRNQIWCQSVPPAGNTPPIRKVPIRDTAVLAETGYADAYQAEHADLRIDSLNLLYVALTRAADNLYVYGDLQVSESGVKPDTVGALLMEAYSLPVEQLCRDYADPSAPCYAEYTLGDAPYIHCPRQESKAEPFGFRNATAVPAAIHSDSGQVRFRQSQEAALYTALGKQAEVVLEHIDQGNVCHDIFAHISVREDAAEVIERFYQKGIIGSPDQRRSIEQRIGNAWKCPEMCDWFGGGWQLLREQAILIDGREVRPDRVMLRGNQAVVLDYKFGQPDPDYHRQVEDYMHALSRLGYTDVSGYLWYANTATLVQVKANVNC